MSLNIEVPMWLIGAGAAIGSYLLVILLSKFLPGGD